MNLKIDETIAYCNHQYSSDDDSDSAESYDFNTPPTPVEQKVAKLKGALIHTVNRIMYSPNKPIIETFSIADSVIEMHDRLLLYANIDTQEMYIPNGLYDLLKDNVALCSQENIKALFMHLQFLTMVLAKVFCRTFAIFLYEHLTKIKSALNRALNHFILIYPDEANFYENILEFSLNIHL